MLIKSKEVDHDQIAYLNELLNRDLPEASKEQVERQLRTIGSGLKNEKDATYYLDRRFKDSRNWALIHDLRLESDDGVAQIDHLLIGRMLDMYVIESKYFSAGVAINEKGEFSYFYGNHTGAIPSLIAQNKQNIKILERLLVEKDILPKRLGLQLKPAFRSCILVSPTAQLTKPTTGTLDTSMVMNSDQFLGRFDKSAEEASLTEISNLTKVIAADTLFKFSTRLVRLHAPSNVDYRSKFALEGAEGIDSGEAADTHPSTTSDGKPSRKGYFCASCKKPISKRVALFCFTKKNRFGGKAYCFDCQQAITEEVEAQPGNR